MDNNSTLTDNILSQYGGKRVNDLCNLVEFSNLDYEPSFVKHSPYFSATGMPSFMITRENNFTILSLNVQSINAKISKLQLLVHQLHSQNIFIDAIAIQESWLKHDESHELSNLTQLQIEGYNIKSQGYSCSKHGGLMFYTRSDYAVKTIESFKNSTVWEGLFVELKKESTDNKIVLGNIYKPPKQNNNLENIQKFTEELVPILEKIKNNNVKFLLAGDFNIDVLKIKQRDEFSEFIDIMMNDGFFPTITLPTRFSTRSCSLLDNIYFNQGRNTQKTDSGIIFTDISDHLPCFTTIDFQTKSQKRPPKYVKQKINTESAMQSMLHELQ